MNRRRAQGISPEILRKALTPQVPGKPLWVDPTFTHLADAIKHAREFAREYEQTLARDVLAATGWDHPRQEQGEAAWKSLVLVERALEARAQEIAQERGSAEWLWYLRRAQWLWQGLNSMSTTAPYVGAIAEAASAWSTIDPTPSLSKAAIVFPTDEAAARSVLRMRAVACLLYDTQNSLRWAGKGAAITAVPGKIPAPVREASLQRFIRLYDRRTASEVGGSFLSRAGLHGTFDRLPDKAEEIQAIVPLIGSSGHGRYGLGSISLGRVPLLNDSSVPAALRWPRELLDLVVLTWTTILSESLHEKIQVGLVPFGSTGYRVAHKTRVLDEIDRALWILGQTRLGGAIPPEVNLGTAEEILGRLIGGEVSAWLPTSGPAVRVGHEDGLFIDLAAASLRINTALARPAVSGSLVNVWAAHFERSVQSAIDATEWKPRPDLAVMRGHVLRRNGSAITDIDAIGERGGTLLVVSCKALPFTIEWDRGDYRTVRNIATRVEADVLEWRDRLETLEQHRSGDNYDFSAARSLLGVVVYPHAPWTTSTTATGQVKSGLHAASSVAELADWCRRSKR